MKAIVLAIVVILSNTGCLMQRHFDIKDREVEYRHQERMRELQIREQELQRAKPVPSTSPIIHNNPF